MKEDYIKRIIERRDAERVQKKKRVPFLMQNANEGELITLFYLFIIINAL